MDEVDVVVIGAGPAGENVAGRCADGGMRVVIVERELISGECSSAGQPQPTSVSKPSGSTPAAGSTVMTGCAQ
jgi:dihydrolipoamide dehydrogenase